MWCRCPAIDPLPQTSRVTGRQASMEIATRCPRGMRAGSPCYGIFPFPFATYLLRVHPVCRSGNNPQNGSIRFQLTMGARFTINKRLVSELKFYMKVAPDNAPCPWMFLLLVKAAALKYGPAMLVGGNHSPGRATTYRAYSLPGKLSQVPEMRVQGLFAHRVCGQADGKAAKRACDTPGSVPVRAWDWFRAV